MKNIYFVGLPHFFKLPLELIFKSSKKIQNRTIIVRELNELKDFIDLSLLPNEHGGKHAEAEMIK
jgi:hypothetical protein